jgi:iron donor protein CyaY
MANPSNKDNTKKVQNDFLDDSSFRIGVQTVFDTLFDELEDLESDDFEIQMQPGSFVITFEDDNSVFMLSQQTPTREIWLSANYQAWHFLFSSETWVERDSDISLQNILQDLFSTKLSEQVDISL